jgi:hypothetical protein
MRKLEPWKGRPRCIDHRGYVRVCGAPGGGWEYEHRLRVEERLGRRLRADESVHHRNEVRSDNRDENLEVMASGSHVGHHNRVSPKRRNRVGLLQGPLQGKLGASSAS